MFLWYSLFHHFVFNFSFMYKVEFLCGIYSQILIFILFYFLEPNFNISRTSQMSYWWGYGSYHSCHNSKNQEFWKLMQLPLWIHKNHIIKDVTKCIRGDIRQSRNKQQVSCPTRGQRNSWSSESQEIELSQAKRGPDRSFDRFLWQLVKGKLKENQGSDFPWL